MNRIQKKRLYESIMKNVSKTVKKKLNEIKEYIDKNSYGYKWCINNEENPTDPVVLYTEYDYKTDTRVPCAIVRAATDNYYRIKSELLDYLHSRYDDFPEELKCVGQFPIWQLDKNTLDTLDNGYMYDLEYDGCNIYRH